MTKTDVLNKLNNAEDTKSALNKIKIELVEKTSQVIDLQKINDDIRIKNNDFKIKLKDLLDERDIQIEKYNHFKSNSHELIDSLTSTKKNLLAVLSILAVALITTSYLYINLFFFSEKLPSNERKNLNNKISSYEKELLINRGKIISAEELIIKKDKQIEKLALQRGSIYKEHAILKKAYDNADNCSRLPFAK